MLIIQKGMQKGIKHIKTTIAMLLLGLLLACTTMTPPPTPTETPAPVFQISSASIESDTEFRTEQQAAGFGCSGGNLSPELRWTGAPDGTKSYAVAFLDEEGPTGMGLWHWVLFNIPVSITGLAEGAGTPALKLAPEGSVQARNDMGTPGYLGACPPQGRDPHHYTFTVYALPTETIPFDDYSYGPPLGTYLNSNALAKASMTVVFGR